MLKWGNGKTLQEVLKDVSTENGNVVLLPEPDQTKLPKAAEHLWSEIITRILEIEAKTEAKDRLLREAQAAAERATRDISRIATEIEKETKELNEVRERWKMMAAPLWVNKGEVQ